MKITCVLEKLKNAVAKTERITTKKASLPVLECLLFVVEDNTLSVRATNLEIGIDVTVPVKVESAGRVAVPAGVISQFLSHLPADGSVTIEHTDGTLAISTESSNTEIKTQPADEFPSIPAVDSGQEITIDTETLTDGFRSVWYAASPSSMKPELSSVYLYSEEDALHFVATDSFRLAERVIADTGVSDLSVLIPHKNVSEIIRILGDVGGKTELKIGENQLAIQAGNIYISSRLIDGSFPDYKKIIPGDSEATAVVATEALSNSLRISDIFSDKFNQLTVGVDPQDGSLALTTSNADVGENTTNIPAEISGDELVVQFNHRYITDAFGSISAGNIELSLSSGAPMVMRPDGDDSFLYLVMPMSG